MRATDCSGSDAADSRQRLAGMSGFGRLGL
jgi:hypothetical protein